MKSAYDVGVLKERKIGEGRVGLTPGDVRAIVAIGGSVLVERGAGAFSRFSDKDYQDAGAVIASEPIMIWMHVDMIIKIREPISAEYQYLPLLKNKLIFAFLHLAGSERRLTELLLEHEITAIASEMIAEIPPAPWSAASIETTLSPVSATLPFVLHVVRNRLSKPSVGTFEALKVSFPLRRALQTWRGWLINSAVSRHHGTFAAHYPAHYLFP